MQQIPSLKQYKATSYQRKNGNERIQRDEIRVPAHVALSVPAQLPIPGLEGRNDLYWRLLLLCPVRQIAPPRPRNPFKPLRDW